MSDAMAVQTYLRSGKTPDDLAAEFNIVPFYPPESPDGCPGGACPPRLPLVGFTYRPDSPRFHPIVRECRGLVLEEGSWDVVARPFQRFYNPGETPEEFQKFDWTDFSTTEKLDGSLIILYHYDGKWRVNTKGSFGQGKVGASGKTWEELFWQTVKLDTRRLATRCTYLFELWTPHNNVLRVYPKPMAWLLTVFENATGRETGREIDMIALKLGCARPEYYHFQSHDDIASHLAEMENVDKTFEGVVIRDSNNLRFKLKSKTYLELHHIKNNGNICNPANLVPLILKGETSEVLAYIPEAREHMEKTAKRLDEEYATLRELWAETKDIESQKEFALAIAGRTPFTAILFNTRKIYGEGQTEDSLKDQWSRHHELIARKLYG